MARLVILKFEDNVQAEAFSRSTSIRYTMQRAPLPIVSDAEVLALLPLPTQFCEGCSRSKRGISFVRGKKYGWWVCTVCAKPSKTTGEKLWRAIASQAMNLLKDKQEPLTGFEEGWGVSKS